MPTLGEANVRDLEARARNLRRGRLRGYRRDEVDALLDEALRILRDLVGENEALRAGGSPEDGWWPATSRMSGFDVQDRRFQGVRIGGYDMRSVDEYLDDVSDLLDALLHENEALRSRSRTGDRS
jgi:DivIVA domain-containing protein